MNRRFDRAPLALAAVLVTLQLTMRALGLAVTTQMLSGSTTSPAEILCGAVYVLVALLAWLVAPCLALASGLDGLARLLGRPRGRESARAGER